MIKNLSKEYRSALKDFLQGGGETALENAYLLGRQALEQGIGILDIASTHHQVLATLFEKLTGDTSHPQLAKQAGKFLAECLSPFEMAQRGFRESIASLNFLNNMLEDEVEKRTRAMRISEERYRTLIDISPDAITMTDLEGKVALCNHLSAQLHGYANPEELIGESTDAFVAPEDMPRVAGMSEQVLHDGGIGKAEYMLIAKTGVRTPVEARVTVVRDVEGHPTGFIGITRDISERKNVELKLESHARRQEVLMDLGLRALSGVDMHTLIRETIDLLVHTLKVDFCELLELIPEKDVLLLRAGLGWQDGLVGSVVVQAGDASQAGYTLLKAEPVIVENMTAENRFAPSDLLRDHNIMAGITVIVHSKERPYGVLGVHTRSPRQFTDDEVNFLQSLANLLAMAFDNRRLLETESRARKRAEDEKDRTIRSLAIISHELRTPLTSIKGFASTLLADDIDWSADQQRDFIQTINEEANKLNGFIDQVLDLSRIDAGLFKFALTRQSVGELVSVNMTHLHPLVERHHLIIEIPTALPDVLADTQRVGQVLSNLVENAVKYSPEGTNICISAQPSGTFVRFSVSDEGPGISEEEREKIFQPFYRTENKITSKAKGVGLGLTICLRLIHGQGGRIWVDERHGPGAVINFTLPVADAVQETEQPWQGS